MFTIRRNFNLVNHYCQYVLQCHRAGFTTLERNFKVKFSEKVLTSSKPAIFGSSFLMAALRPEKLSSVSHCVDSRFRRDVRISRCGPNCCQNSIRHFAKGKNKPKKKGAGSAIIDDSELDAVVPIAGMRNEMNKVVNTFRDKLIQNLSLRTNLSTFDK